MKLKYLIALPIFALASCASNWVASNKAVDYTSQPKKIFFRVEVTQADPIFGQAFIKALEDELASALRAQQIETAYTPFNPISLETKDDMEKSIVDFDPDVILTITKSVPFNTDDMQINNLDVKLTNVAQDKIYWRGSLNRTGIWVGRNGGEACAQSIMKRLRKDGIIR